VPRDLAGAVLCGGLSRRMGTDKALLCFEGVSLVERAVARLRGVCEPVVIAPGGHDIEVPGCATVDDAAHDAGPLAGLLAALRASPHQLLAVVAVDMPWVDPALIVLMAARCAGLDAIVPLSEHGPEPLHAVYARSAIAACEAAVGGEDRSLRGVLAHLQVGYVTEAEWRAAGIDPGFARNLNTPEDLEAVNR
jgi:molybdenum cofactor guanylyltransferase